MGAVLERVEKGALEQAKGRVNCLEKVARYLFTRLGPKNNQLLNATRENPQR